MSKIKKIISVVICFVIVFSFSACSGNGEKPEQNGKLNIICTVFPQYDWVKNILGNTGDAELTLLLDNGVDLHNYQPSVDDLVKISECDMFIYVGGESDEWVEDALENATNKNMKAINLLDILGERAKEEEHIEGMEEHEEEVEEEDEEYDEHIWLSLKNAKILCEALSNELQAIDSKNAEAYKNNTDSYISSLNELDEKYQTACNNAKTNILLFGDRFPFRYLTDDYGLTYYAAFAGCSAETEASFETISFLSEKVDENNLKAVITIEGSNNKIAQTIIDNTKAKNQKILSLNSMQGSINTDSQSYLSIMESNLEVLKEALA